MITYVYEAMKRIVSKFYDTANSVHLLVGIESITRSGSVATLTKKSHGLTNGQSVIISGSDQTEYNGTVTVGGATADTFTYTVTGTPVTPATGAAMTLADTNQSQRLNLPEAIFISSIAAATTVKVEASISLDLGWTQLGADLTNANNGTLIQVPGKYNFVRLRRSTGSGAVLAYAQL